MRLFDAAQTLKQIWDRRAAGGIHRAQAGAAIRFKLRCRYAYPFWNALLRCWPMVPA